LKSLWQLSLKKKRAKPAAVGRSFAFRREDYPLGTSQTVRE
jgi:hypothetical protein